MMNVKQEPFETHADEIKQELIECEEPKLEQHSDLLKIDQDYVHESEYLQNVPIHIKKECEVTDLYMGLNDLKQEFVQPKSESELLTLLPIHCDLTTLKDESIAHPSYLDQSSNNKQTEIIYKSLKEHVSKKRRKKRRRRYPCPVGKHSYNSDDQEILLALLDDDQLEFECNNVLQRLENNSDIELISSDEEIPSRVFKNVADIVENQTVSETSEGSVVDGTNKIVRKKKSKKQKIQMEWQKRKYVSRKITPKKTRNVHHNTSNEEKTPVSYFLQYFSSHFFEKMAEMTNTFALQSGQTFKPTNKNEMTTFVGLHIIMGCLSFPRVRMYWDSLYSIGLFLNTMSRNRFFLLRRNVHIVNNLEKAPGSTDKLYKVRPFFESLRNRCLELQKENSLRVDSQIVPFTGRLNFKQYVKNKPCPWGIKIFVLCGASGMAYDFLIYQGSTTEIPTEYLDKFGMGPSVVLQLTKDVPENTYVYFDNYFTSYLLFEELTKRHIYSVGTVRLDRFQRPPFTSDKQFSKQERGYSEEVVNEEGSVVLVKWQDNKVVIVGSNFMGKGTEDIVKRWDKTKKKFINIQRPDAIKLYNKSMGGVALLNQLLSYYRVFIKSKKWTLRMIFHAFDLACVNSWLEYKVEMEAQKTPRKEVLDLLHFKLKIGEALIAMSKSVPKQGHPRGQNSPQHSLILDTPKRRNAEIRPSKQIRQDLFDHCPEYDDKKEATRCKNLNCKNRTHVFCEKCRVHLCFMKGRNCFKTFHFK